MDKKTMEQINMTVRKAEEFHDNMYDLVEACNMLLKENERLEARHKADQQAIEEANAIAEAYMKRCKDLYDEKNKAKKEKSSLESSAADMVKRVHEVGISVIDLEAPTWEHISKIVKDEKLKYLKSYSTKDLVDELKKRRGISFYHVDDPTLILTVID